MKDNNEKIETLDFEEKTPSIDEPTEMLDFSADLKVSCEIDEMLDFFDVNTNTENKAKETIKEVEKQDDFKIELDASKEKLDEYVPSIKDFNIKSAKVRKIVYKSMLYVVIIMLLGFEFFVSKTGDILNNLRVYASNVKPIKIMQNDKYGYIDYTGNKIVNPKYIYGEDFVKGYAIVKNSSNLPLIIDKGGKEAASPGVYFSIYRAGSDIIVSKVTKKGLRYAILDEDLKKKTDFSYDLISYDGNIFTYTKGNYLGIINSSGKEIFSYKLTDSDDKKMYINPSTVTDSSYDRYAVITINSSSQIVNLNNGKTVSSPTLNEIVPEENNVFYEKLPNNGKRYMYIENDNIVLESDNYISLSISSLKAGVLKSLDSSYKYEFISTSTGEQFKKNLNIEETYEGDEAFIYKNYNFKKNQNELVIVKNGKVFKTIDGNYEVYKGFVNGIAIIRFDDNTYGYLNVEGNFINDSHYTECHEFDSYGDAIAKKENGYGVVNKYGKTVIEFENEDVKMASSLVKKNTLVDNNIFYAVKKDNRYGLFNSKGKKVNDKYYDEVTFDNSYGIVKIETDINDALILSKSMKEINITSSNMKYEAYENYIKIKNEYYNYEGKMIYVDNSKGELDNE